MSKDTADFTVRLIDKVTGGSKRAGRSVRKMTSAFDASGKSATHAGKASASALGTTASAARKAERAVGRYARRARGAGGRFTGGGGASGGGGGGGRYRDKGGRMREPSGRFVGGGGGGGGRGGFLGGSTMDFVKGSLITSAIMQMGQLAARIAGAAGSMVMFGQNSRLAFGQLAKHGQDPEKLFEHSRALATRLGLDVMETTKQYQKFLALQFTPKGAGDMLKMGADLQALGNSAEQVQGVFMALGQIKSKGRLQAEEMMQLAERGISGDLIWQEIGKLMGGKSNDQVRKLQEQGKVTADVGLKAIENAVNRKLGQTKLGESGAKFADTTIQGMLGRFKAVGQDKGLTMLDKLTAPLTKFAGRGLDAFESFVGSPEGAKTIDSIASALGKAAEFAGDMFGWFTEGFGDTWSQMSDGARAMFAVFSGGDGAATVNIIKMLVRGIGQAAAVAIGFGLAFVGAAAGAAALGVVVWEVAKALGTGIIQALGDAWVGITGWWDDLGALWSGGHWFDLGANIIGGLVKGMVSLITWPVKTIVDLGNRVGNALKNTLGIHSPSRVFADIGARTGEGFAVGITSSTRDAQRASAHMGKAAAFSANTGVVGSPASRANTDDVWGPSMLSMSAPASADSRAGGGDRRVSVTLNVAVHSDGDAAETARLTARDVRREIEGFFQQLDMETA